jgi:hypothetical protein
VATFYVPILSGRLTTRSIDSTVNMATSRLRYVLGQRYQQQIRERAIARCAAKDARKAAALEAAAREAEAQEAAVEAEMRGATA